MENIVTIREHILSIIWKIGKIKYITSFNIWKNLETQRWVKKLLDKVKYTILIEMKMRNLEKMLGKLPVFTTIWKINFQKN